MATISDVAVRAGVSTATVSRALNGKSTVDPQLATRVADAAAELGYRPNGLARSLRRRETAVLVLIISDVANPFFTAIARGVEDVAQAVGHSVVLCNSDDDADKERRYIDVAMQEQAAGVLLSPTGAQTDVHSLLERGTPVVAVDRPLAGAATDVVLVDTRAAAGEATAHLIQQGYRRIACLTGPAGVPTADERLAGYRDALRAARLPHSADLVQRAEFRGAGAKAATARLLDTDAHTRPDALLAANNTLAIGALEAVTEAGLRPGPELGVVAFDDAPWATLIDRPLTVVAQPAYEIGTVAAQLLLARKADNSRVPTTTTLSARLIERASSRRNP